MFFFKQILINWFQRERKAEGGKWEKREKEMREKLMQEILISRLPHVPQPGTETTIWALSICPDWESNSQPFHLWDDTPTNWVTSAWTPADFLKVNLNMIILEENNIYCVKVLYLFINQRHKPKLSLIKLTIILTIKSYQLGKEIWNMS